MAWKIHFWKTRRPPYQGLDQILSFSTSLMKTWCSYALGDGKWQLAPSSQNLLDNLGITQLPFKVFWGLFVCLSFSFLITDETFRKCYFTWWCRKACHTGWPPQMPWRTRWRWPSWVLKQKDPLWNISNFIRFANFNFWPIWCGEAIMKFGSILAYLRFRYISDLPAGTALHWVKYYERAFSVNSFF